MSARGPFVVLVTVRQDGPIAGFVGALVRIGIAELVYEDADVCCIELRAPVADSYEWAKHAEAELRESGFGAVLAAGRVDLGATVARLKQTMRRKS